MMSHDPGTLKINVFKDSLCGLFVLGLLLWVVQVPLKLHRTYASCPYPPRLSPGLQSQPHLVTLLAVTNQSESSAAGQILQLPLNLGLPLYKHSSI